jgi:hypothetical protein
MLYSLMPVDKSRDLLAHAIPIDGEFDPALLHKEGGVVQSPVNNIL